MLEASEQVAKMRRWKWKKKQNGDGPFPRDDEKEKKGFWRA